MTAPVTLNQTRQRFEMPIEGDAMAICDYRVDDGGAYHLLHAEVPPAFEGRGIGGALARGVFDLARDQRLKLVPRCSFMVAWAKRHPDYADVLA
ncbi:GNAT family N-acetyltransferase [Novosphingobium sp. KACC 22771]|uniref:GNAT family N-acetyltransferase n=1 Tax=Novosphingobium sp. KACC 22771 TaxID=3025670 RepID=UPI00236738CA|nr:GNAT family N-acetyltransferase [Novosphingobium sp. KACC 22771]WDF73111.1 GNAT family N-acetyltransferase [Novosphingobium sp. KACC 22771]